jgi:class 3 adenylate cyclase
MKPFAAHRQMAGIGITLSLFILPVLSSGGQDGAHTPRAINGTLDLSSWNFYEPHTIPLRGDWNFTYGRFENPEAKEPHFDGTVSLPGSWNSYVREGKEAGPYGYATYALKIKIPASETNRSFAIKVPIVFTAFELWIDSRLLYTAGRIGENMETEIPAFKPGFAIFHPEGETINVMIRASNFHHRSGGLIEAFDFGDSNRVIHLRERSLFSEVFLFGAILIMSFYHFSLFTLRREDRGTFWFGMVCMATSIRILANGNYWLMEVFPSMEWEVLRKMEYLSFIVMTPSIAFFVENAFGKVDRRKAYFFTVPPLIYGTIVLFTDSVFFSYCLPYFHLYVIALILYFIQFLIRAIMQRRKGIAAFMIGGVVMIVAVINDLLAPYQLTPYDNLISVGLFIFIFSQSYLLSLIFANTYAALKQVTGHLRKTNEVFARFVPADFLRLMNISDVTDVRLGDQIQKDLTVMFADIINFTSLSENMTPSENFSFLNLLLERIGPVVRKNEGFIDKYLGDGIMALFPKSAANAVAAGIEMQEKIREYNRIRESEGKSHIGIGIGIHHGSAMLGTVGEENRMDATVISDAVNLSSRIEGLTRPFGVLILISSDVLEKIRNRMAFEARYMGRVRVKGKKRPIEIYEILNGLPSDQLRIRISTQSAFERGIALYFQREFSQSAEIFKQIVADDPTDEAARKYMEKSNDSIAHKRALDELYDLPDFET